MFTISDPKTPTAPPPPPAVLDGKRDLTIDGQVVGEIEHDGDEYTAYLVIDFQYFSGHGSTPKDAVNDLFTRRLKQEQDAVAELTRLARLAGFTEGGEG